MRQSQLFTKTKKEDIKGETSLNAQLLLRGGFINKEIAGVYSFLPLGLNVLKKIENIIRTEIYKTLNAQEILMPALHPLVNYKITKRDKIDILFHTKLKSGGDLVLGQSHEEIVTPLIKEFLFSYKDLPCGVFQIQTKFRNELRAKSGILRGREFLMKDLYSFHATEDCFNKYYKKVQEAYRNIFNKLGIGDRTYLVFASGGSFSKYSHEFQTITPAGEDEIYLCKKCKIGINKEVINENPNCPNCGEKKDKLQKEKSIEVGNIFPLNTRFSDAFSLTYKDKDGSSKPVIMGCYGMGISRAMGTIVEVLSDEKGIVWPESVAPFKFHLIELGEDKEVNKFSEKIYNKSPNNILYDDRKDKSVGEKLTEADLIGIPYRIIVSKKTIKNNCVEIKKRDKEKTKIIKVKELQEML